MSMPAPGELWELTKRAFSDWSEDKATKLAAALAYYTMLSIAPLLVICMKIVGKIFGDEAASGQISAYLNQTVGQKGAEAAQEMIKNAGQPSAGILATTISVVVLFLSASGVFGELQDSLNTVWEVKPKPGRGIMGMIKDRFLSMTMVMGVVFLLLVSLIASTVLTGATHAIGLDEGVILSVINFIVSIAVITVLFALIFRYIPDAKVRWPDVWIGAIATSILFTIGKSLLGWYLGRASATSVYGAAGSLVALLIWVYYSAQILFFGAEFTQVYSKKYGRGIEPAENAEPITEQDRTQEGKPHENPGEKHMPTVPALHSSREVASHRAAMGVTTSGTKLTVTAAAALTAGALIGGAIAATRTGARRRQPNTARLDDRLRRIADIAGKAAKFEAQYTAGAVSDRLDELAHRIREAERRVRSRV